MQADDPILVLCTAPDDVVGARLARGLVEQRLAACVNMIAGVRSFYRWKGTLHDDAEVQLVIKSRRGRFDALREWLGEHHPYDVPEVLALPIVAGSEPYLEWISAQTHDDA
ncbi:MAG: divalent-cation tolerance protein CutA [Myxococcales bacterium]|nr:divalent-cation tolerance protein CutA [Myxococcales bacterium]MCB9755223.1 divalent-cation tolerance protein CutA [Myxococcales bacterium]